MCSSGTCAGNGSRAGYEYIGVLVLDARPSRFSWTVCRWVILLDSFGHGTMSPLGWSIVLMCVELRHTHFLALPYDKVRTISKILEVSENDIYRYCKKLGVVITQFQRM